MFAPWPERPIDRGSASRRFISDTSLSVNPMCGPCEVDDAPPRAVDEAPIDEIMSVSAIYIDICKHTVVES